MSYDLIAFDCDAAPADRVEFLDWVARALRNIDGAQEFDIPKLSLGLQLWHREMRQNFPSAYDPHAYPAGTHGADKHANYRLTKNAVRVSVDWEDTGPAFHRARKAAQESRVGLFEASGKNGAVWMISPKGRFEIAHTAEPEPARG